MTRRVHIVLAIAALIVVVVEASTRSQSRYAVECIAVGLALVFAWRSRSELDSAVVVALAVALPAAIATVHLARGVGGDIDVESVYPSQGQSLLDGTYPHSEYPPGAVVLFALEQLVRTPRSVNPFVMAVCAGAIAWSVCAVRTPTARWLAAVVALWPVSAFFWEFKFDALPTALLTVGAVFVLRRHWLVAGALFGLGTAVKWSPAVAAVIVLVWLLGNRDVRAAVRHGAGCCLGFAVVVLPFLVWSPDAVWASVSKQAPRGITPESLWYLPLHAVGRASQPGAVYDAAHVPHGADTVAVIVQIATLLVLAVLVTRVRTVEAAVGLALAGPMVFLLLNKVFSAQYALTLLAAGCMAAALVGRARVVASLLMVATAANVLVYPIGRMWETASVVLFASALAAVVVIAREALTTELS